MSETTREWVRFVDGKFVLTWQVLRSGEWSRGGTRPLTFWERVKWRLLARTPKP